MVEVRDLYDGQVICEGETVKAAVEAHCQRDGTLIRADLSQADLRGIHLHDADMVAAYLVAADLRKAKINLSDLRMADLRDADLRGADLRHSNFSGAWLVRADLRGADLRGAIFIGADFRRANLRDARLNWESTHLVAEILRRHAGDDMARRKVAGLILSTRDLYWEDFFDLDDPEREWAIGVLQSYVQDGDELPEKLRLAFKG